MIAFKTYQLSVPSDPLGLEAFQFAPLQKQNFKYLLAQSHIGALGKGTGVTLPDIILRT